MSVLSFPPSFPVLFLTMTGSTAMGSGVSFQTGPGVYGWLFLDL